MDLGQTLALYDVQIRQQADAFGMQDERLPHLRRQSGAAVGGGCIIHSQLDADTADAAIAGEIAHFQALGCQFEWKLYDYDRPVDLRDRVLGAGFEPDEPETVVVLDIESAHWTHTPDGSVAIRRLATSADVRDLVLARPEDELAHFEAFAELLIKEVESQPDRLSIYVAYVDDRPVAGAWMRLHPGSDFVDLWGGATQVAYRGRGIYTSLVAARIEEARRRGFRLATVDAGPMSLPILQKLGFRPLARVQGFVWRPGTSTS